MRKMPFQTNNCLKCGASFVPTKPHQVYCDSCTYKFTNLSQEAPRTQYKARRRHIIK